MFAIYEGLLFLVFILAIPYFSVVGLVRGKYFGSVRERLGRYPGPAIDTDVWLHAVSVGEVMAAVPIVERIRRMRPETSFVVTTTTLTGQATARRMFPHAAVTYFPFDFSFSVRRFLDHYHPRVYATVETEIWPNVSRHCSRRGMPLILANGRLSDRSFPRYRRFRRLLRPVLSLYSAVLVREETDRERFVAIGAAPERVEVSGNVKFDYEADPRPSPIASSIEALAGERPIFIAGSTVDGEEELLLPLFERLIAAGSFVVLAPRKPERFDQVAALVSRAKIRFRRRSELEREEGGCDLLLLDSIGELARLYAHATAAFIGGSLMPTGGHNPIEAAAVGTPVAFGPHMSNFREIAASFISEHAALEVRDVDELFAFVTAVSADPSRREEWSRRAKAAVEKNRGAAEKTARRIVEAIS
ncbi:MAG: glycosyltransferase N-terminal domain-containing protein [Thermoanaerobaculia bacterium]